MERESEHPGRAAAEGLRRKVTNFGKVSVVNSPIRERSTPLHRVARMDLSTRLRTAANPAPMNLPNEAYASPTSAARFSAGHLRERSSGTVDTQVDYAGIVPSGFGAERGGVRGGTNRSRIGRRHLSAVERWPHGTTRVVSARVVVPAADQGSGTDCGNEKRLPGS